MRKTLIILLSIIFIPSQAFSNPLGFFITIPLMTGSTTLSVNNTASKQKQETKATMGQGNITIGGVSATPSQLEGLNRDIADSQTITYDKIERGLDGSVTVDNRLLIGFLKTEVKDKEGNAVYERDEQGNVRLDSAGNPKVMTVSGYQSLVSDFTNFVPNLIKSGEGMLGGAKAVIEGLEKAYKKIVSESKSKEEAAIKLQAVKSIYEKTEDFVITGDEETDGKIRGELLKDEEVLRFVEATDNLGNVEKYISENEVSMEEADKLRSLAMEEGVYINIAGDGRLEMYGNWQSAAEDMVHLGIEVTIVDGQLLKKYESGSNYEDNYKQIAANAKESIASILLSESPELRNIAGDSRQLLGDAGEVILSLAQGLMEKETYAKAFEGIKSLPETGKTGFDITQALSNPYVLNSILEGAGGGIYDVRNDPLGAGAAVVKNVTNYYIYEAGLSNDNMYYAGALLLFGAATEIVSPFKALKGLDASADILKAGVKAADNVLVHGSDKAFTTIGESAGIGKTGITLNDLKASQPGIDNFFNNFSEKTWSGYTSYYPTGTIDDYMKILHDESPWPLGDMPKYAQLTSKDRIYMVVNEGQDFPGRFATKEEITTLSQVRNDLAVKEVWKSNPARYWVMQPTKGTILDVRYGPIGPQIDLQANKFLPGSDKITQFEIFYPNNAYKGERLKYIEVTPGGKKKITK